MLADCRHREAIGELAKYMRMPLSDLKGLIPLEIGGANGMINVRIAAVQC